MSDDNVPRDEFEGVPVLNLNAVSKELTAGPIAVLEVEIGGERYRWPVYRRNLGLRCMQAAKDEDQLELIRAALDDDRLGRSINLGPETVERIWEFINREMGFDKPGESSASPASSPPTTTPSRPIYTATSV